MSLIRICKKGQNKARSAISPPLLPLNSGAHGSLAIYQTVSRRGILRSPFAGSFIPPVPQGRRTVKRSGRGWGAEHYILWWDIKMRYSVGEAVTETYGMTRPSGRW